VSDVGLVAVRRSRPLRILQIAGTGVGGRWFLDQVCGLSERGHHILAVLPSEGSLSEALRTAGIECVVVPFKGMKVADLPRLMVSEWRLIRLMRAFRPDVVHYHLLKAIVLGRLAAYAARVPVRVSQWPGDVHRMSRFLRWCDDTTATLDSVILGSSRAIVVPYAAKGYRTAVVYYGFRTADWPDRGASTIERATLLQSLGLEPGRPTVAIVGHMYPTKLAGLQTVGVKGHEVFIAAARRLVSGGRDAQFLVVGDELEGDGSYRRRLETQASDMTRENRLVFTGHRTDLKTLLSCIDVVAIPSLSESASYVAMEALLLRRAVVASDVGGLPDTIIDGETGLLVPPRDEDALARAMERLLDDADLRERLGATGRQHVLASFDIARSIDALENTYMAALDERSR
jgi:glycosyltransferase involved in cell wall biosynthesis